MKKRKLLRHMKHLSVKKWCLQQQNLINDKVGVTDLTNLNPQSLRASEGIKWCQAFTGERVINLGNWNLRAEWVEKRIFYRKIYNLCSNLKGGKICPKKRYYCPSNMQTSVLSSQIKVKVCYTFQAQRVINWGIKNLKSDCFHPIKTFPIVSLNNGSTLFVPLNYLVSAKK